MYVLLSQTTRYLIDPRTHMHDKLQLKKELANELVGGGDDHVTCPCDLIV